MRVALTIVAFFAVAFACWVMVLGFTSKHSASAREPVDQPPGALFIDLQSVDDRMDEWKVALDI